MPQLEDGYIRIATELWEALTQIRISGEARQVLDAIIRKTYGWQKKQDIISLSQLGEMTGLKQVHIIRARNKLIKMNLIVTKKGNDGNVSYSIQKNYKEWKPLPKKVTLPKKVIDITQKGNRGVPKKVHTKDTNTKDTIKDTIKDNSYVENSIEFQLAKFLYSEILKRKPDFKKPNLQVWTKYIDYMIRLDNRKSEKIKEVIMWCQQDDFWQNNILSTQKLRKQFDQLELKKRKKKEKRYGVV